MKLVWRLGMEKSHKVTTGLEDFERGNDASDWRKESH